LGSTEDKKIVCKAKREQVFVPTGSDINGDGSLTLLSTDRLTETSVAYEKLGTDWFLVTSRKTI